MTIRELTRFALGGLWRQKVRTILTLIGVTVGTCALAFSVALGVGLHAFIENEFHGRDEFWRIMVFTGDRSPDAKAAAATRVQVAATISDNGRRARLQEALVERDLAAQGRLAVSPLTHEKLAEIAALPDVRDVRTYRTAMGRLASDCAEKQPDVDLTTGPLADLAPRMAAGRLPDSDDAKEIVLSELALYDLGLRDDTRWEDFVGKTVRLKVGGIGNSQAQARVLMGRLPVGPLSEQQKAVLEKIADELPRNLHLFSLTDEERRELSLLLSGKVIPVEETYRVCGIVRLTTEEERKKAGPLASSELAMGNAFLPPGAGRQLLSRLPTARDGAVYFADVRVKPGSDLQTTVDAIEAMGFRTFSLAKWFAAARREVTIVVAGLNLFAMIALFVAGIGITNTLVTSVVERTKEIGILRAVGATRAQVQGMFLAEGAFIGLLGSLFGLAMARGLAIPADAWVHGFLKQQVESERMLSTTVFAFPWWLWVGSVAFAAIVTTAAAYYPASRAAKIHPIEALRYG